MTSDFLGGAERRQAQLIDDLRALVESESPSNDLDAVRVSANAVHALIRSRLSPSSVELLEIEGRSHVKAVWGDGDRRVLVLAHHDTVWPMGTIDRLPWGVDGGVIRGPGTLDMKLGLVQAIHALAILEQDQGTQLDGVTLLVTGDEELGSPSSRRLIEEEARGATAVFVLEAGADDGSLKTARKGVSQYAVQVLGRAAHAGLEPEAGVNASIELAHQVLAIAGLADSAAGTSVTPTVVSGGTTENTVPAEARVAVDVRAWSQAEQQRVDDAIRALRPVGAGAELNVTGGINRPPLEKAQSGELFERARELAQEHGLAALSSAAVGGASDGNLTAGLGVPTLDGLGAIGGGAHADSEHALVAYIDERVALLALLVRDVLGRGE